MLSVTQRVKNIKQPRGGYVNPSIFTIDTYDDGIILNEEENVHASIVGMAVDYLTRVMLGVNPTDAFDACEQLSFGY